MEEGLALFPAALEIAGAAVFADLSQVSADGLPAFDLPFVIGASSAHVKTTIPLEPTAGVFVVNPTFFAPDGKGLRSIHAEVVQSGIMPIGA